MIKGIFAAAVIASLSFPPVAAMAGGGDFWPWTSPADATGPELVDRVVYAKGEPLSIDGKTFFLAAAGEVRSGGFTDATLDPVFYVIEPADGFYDFVFVATPPNEQAVQVISVVTASGTWLNDPKIKGLRVHGKENCILIKFGDAEPEGGRKCAAPGSE